jgi:O-antigen/teichoic acid export membrane protein
VILRARRGSEDEGPARPLREVVRPVTSFGLKLWPGTLSGIIILRLDQVLIAPFAGAGELGLFAVAVSVAELPATALVAVRDIVFAASTDRQSPTLVAHATRVVVLVTVPICAAGILVAPFVVPLLFGDDFRGAVGMSQILLAAAVPSGVGMILSGGLLGIGRPGTASAVQVTAAAVTVIGLVVTVPIFGAIAAAWTALGSRLLSAVLATYAIVRHTDLGVAECVVPRMADARDLGERLRTLLRR